MIDILQLPGWVVSSMNTHANCLVIEATYTKADTACHKCGVIGQLYKHGTKVVSYRDIPVRMMPTIIQGTVQRYRCKECGETFVQKPDGIDDFRRMTERCIEFIKDQSVPHSFTHLAELVGCVEGTIRGIASERLEELGDTHKPYLPEWMGMDETQLDGKLRGVITDIGNRRPIDLLPDRDKPTIIKWLSQFKDKTPVKGLAIDMWLPYKDAAQLVFPGLPVVVDKYHVVRMATRAMEDIRIALAKTEKKVIGRDWMRRKNLLRMSYKNLDEKGRFNLQMWLDNYPEIAVAYHLKEGFYKIYEAPTREEGGRLLDEWRASVPVHMRRGKKDFGALLTATANWREEILNVFDYPITNGYTEAFNGVVKVINRNARGYGFDVLRAKVLSRKPREKKAVRAPSRMERMTNMNPTDAPRHICSSCGGVFDMTYWFFMPALNNNQKDTWDNICTFCNSRFHTTGINQDIHDSTPKYE